MRFKILECDEYGMHRGDVIGTLEAIVFVCFEIDISRMGIGKKRYERGICGAVLIRAKQGKGGVINTRKEGYAKWQYL